MKFDTGHFIALLLGFLLVPLTAADCCYKDCGCYINYAADPPVWVCITCGDCSFPTPCCGNGPCNIFCCNCDGGCRNGDARSCPSQCSNQNSFPAATFMPKAQTPLHEGSASFYDARAPDNGACSYDSTFDSVDKDHSGEITLSEYLLWVDKRDKGVRTNATTHELWISYFYSFDKNKDGKIQFGEMHRTK